MIFTNTYKPYKSLALDPETTCGMECEILLTVGSLSQRAQSIPACKESSLVLAYFDALQRVFASSVSLRFLSFSTCRVHSVANLRVLVSVSPLILFHVIGPHIGPSLIRRPAPAHLDFHDPLWLQLITFPPSNLVLMCIHNSARLVVKLSAGVCACVC